MIQQYPIAISGIRPSKGGLHLGHYIGNIEPIFVNQDKCETFILLGDLHLATDLQDIASLKEFARSAIFDMVADILATGINPETTKIFLQSHINENIMNMVVVLGHLVTLSRLQRIPAIKAILKVKQDNINYSIVQFPVVQTIDILSLRAASVYANSDNKPFVEFANDIVHKFNRVYGDFFGEIKLVHGRIPLLVGTDGSKMSKAKNNSISLTASNEDIKDKIRKMYTDPARVHANIPGNTANNPIFVYHRLFNKNTNVVEELEHLYTQGKIGDVDVKNTLSRAIIDFIEPIREKSFSLRSKEKLLTEILQEGIIQANHRISMTIKEFSELTGLGANSKTVF